MMMMKSSLALLCMVAIAMVSAADQASGIRVQVRSADGKTHGVKLNTKFTTTPIGQQCAYDLTLDPSLYPCKEMGVCVRFNATYGECLTKEEAARIESQDESGSGSDLEESESGSGSESESESGSSQGEADEEEEEEVEE